MPPEAAATVTESSAATTTSATVESPSATKGKGPSLDEAIAKAVAGVTDEPAPPAPAKGKEKERARRVEKLEQKAAAKAEAAPEPEPDGNALEKARYHLQHGDVAKAIDVAFGELKADGLPDQVREAIARKLGVGSAQWEKFRKHEQAARRAHATREQELQGVIEGLKKEFGPLHNARLAYRNGDFEAAFKGAFGEDSAEFQRKIVGQRVGKNPEIEKLRAEIEGEREERRKLEVQRAEEANRAEVERLRGEYVTGLRDELASSDDADIARFAQKPAFVRRVFSVLQQNYDAATRTTVPTRVAAEHVRDQILSELRDWNPDAPGAQPAKTVQAGAQPAKQPARPAVRTLKQTSAAEAVGAPAKRSSKEILAHHQSLMERTLPE